jgi:hypothetical protein
MSSSTTVQRDRSTERRRTARRPPERRPELAALALDDLRAYRQELVAEESRVSYWRRILHARLDLSVRPAGTPHRLREVLAEHRTANRRLAMSVHDHVDLPPLPDLTVLWDTEYAAGDDALLTRLSAAEAELSAYRRSLHGRLDDATAELIARYRDEPALALRALPLPRQYAS